MKYLFNKIVPLVLIASVLLAACGGAGAAVKNGVGDLVWDDANANGIQDTQEEGVEGVEVILYTADGAEVSRTTTNAEGQYAFADQQAGDYYMVFIPPNGFVFTMQDAGNDDGVDSDVDVDGESAVFTLGETQKNETLDAGLVVLVAGPIPTDTPTPTPTPEEPPEEPTETPHPTHPPEDYEETLVKQEVSITMDDGSEVKFIYYPAAGCKTKTLLVYYPWIIGDMHDWDNYLRDLFPEGYLSSLGVVSITPPGCEGGCKDRNTDLWWDAFNEVMKMIENLECLEEDYQVIFMGASVGADMVLRMCAAVANCQGVISLSPGGYAGVDLLDEINALIDLGIDMLLMYAEGDYVAEQSAWSQFEGTEGVNIQALAGTDAHGLDMLTTDTMHFITDFIDSLIGD